MSSSAQQASKKQRKCHEVTHVLVIDVEATGQNLVQNWMPEFGAVVSQIGCTSFDGSFYACLQQPDNTEWDLLTKREFWDNPDHGKDGKTPRALLSERQASNVQETPREAMKRFCDWCTEQKNNVRKAGGKMLVFFDTAGFDASWINYYLSKYGKDCSNINQLFGDYSPARDIDSFKFGMARQLKVWGSENVALEAIGESELPDWVTSHEHNHNPLSDAKHIAAQCSFFLDACLEDQ